MLKFALLRVSPAAAGLAGLAVLAVVAAAPAAAQAADTTATGTLAGGLLTNTAPAITPFSADLTGLVQTKNTAVGAWTVTDPRGSDEGYSITVSATAPTVDADGAGTTASPVAITGSTMKLYTTTAVAVGGNANTKPVAAAAQQLDLSATPTASTIQNAVPGTGQGPWSFPEDTDPASGLEIVIPGTATPGVYASTLTYTTAAPA
jgi:hypothetical protein